MPDLAKELRRATAQGYRVTIAPADGLIGRHGCLIVDVVGPHNHGPHTRQLVDVDHLDLDADRALALTVRRGTAAVTRAADPTRH